MSLPNPFPTTLKEAVWQALVAILIATRLKDISGFFRRLWTAFRESSATAKVRSAEAHKTDAEAEEIQTRTAVSTAGLIREMTMSMGEAGLLEKRLKEKLATQESTISLLKIENADLKQQIEESAQAKKA